MTDLVTSAQMRAIERTAFESGVVTGLDLMERAGEGVVAAIQMRWPDAQRVTVLCGPGNNGGDGFVVARLLREAGCAVRVLAAAVPDRMPPDAAENARRWLEAGVILPLTRKTLNDPDWGRSDLYVDAIFGTGLSRPPKGDIASVLLRLGGASGDGEYYSNRLVAIDAPSGLCLDSGRILLAGESVPHAALTVTFHCLKAGHVLSRGPEVCGEVVVHDIGLEPWLRNRKGMNSQEFAWFMAGRTPPLGLVSPLPFERMNADARVGSFMIEALNKFGRLSEETHKYTYGHALVLTGGMGRTGAARLAARAALRVGAGLVTLGAPGGAMLECAAQITALMLRRVEGGGDLAALLGDPRITALCLGPGMGVERAAEMLAVVREGGVKPHPTVVVDADGLTALGPVAAPLPPGWVLTPHGGEFARLFPDLAAKLTAPADTGPAYSKVDATREAAARAGCVVLFKGPDTVIAAPDGRAAVHAATGARAVPWLATAGAGDVLAGLIAGLCARGLGGFEAACAAAWLHVEAARAFGPGLIAEDLPEALPGVLRALG
ncbi:NAD(P)H-hydrate dehydratase [Pararhodobacter aggregans]|uniref:Bifunctional NAD(P)H-hydrate repair enzyme n=1 Tax=Pararhodobacter aggregans TaxID=404875 RepID=A0A2T7UXY5_9RHOB|nr:NAD(P)H-hydrate dehydratase [Pararhodobacter aggregans]PTX05205.1 hydroxyethylthiazole kinase-like uncharacterized protein yjeF/hydroxyethylthiazole kinase-like uncharacterized protein yjeF [Pararhodobacter aggregans]PVE49504.1 bifunctional ADP-dependent NAD(P)H-hydrate dehydratase/NAD(P)H-hydrate epimerase [Pararhodobacter aggregans]